MEKQHWFIVFSLFLCFQLTGQQQSLPLDSTAFMPLEKVRDKGLEADLKKMVNSHPKWNKLVKSKKMTIGVVDISDPAAPRYGAVNGKHMMYAASLPKIAVMVAVMDAVERGEITMTADIEDHLNKMIRVSNNASSSALIDLVGYERISRTLRDERYLLYNPEKQGGLWVGKRYGKGGKRNPDPLKGISHAASAFQVCRFYYMLAYGKLINCQRSEQMLGYLYDPHLHHKFVNSFDQIVPEADLYRKSGTWRNFHSDSVMVIGNEWRSYILVALVEDPQGESIMRDLVYEVDKILGKKKNYKE